MNKPSPTWFVQSAQLPHGTEAPTLPAGARVIAQTHDAASVLVPNVPEAVTVALSRANVLRHAGCHAAADATLERLRRWADDAFGSGKGRGP